MIGGVKQGRVHVKNWVWVHFKAGQNIFFLISKLVKTSCLFVILFYLFRLMLNVSCHLLLYPYYLVNNLIQVHYVYILYIQMLFLPFCSPVRSA
jgi:hypothetical protein